MLRTAGYWLFFVATIAIMLTLWEALARPPESLAELLSAVVQRYLPAMVTSLVVLPLVMIDVLRLSHRFVGPVLRIRQGLQELAAGKRPGRIKFRENDFWPDMAAEFNAAAEHFEESHDALVSTRMTNTLS
jgi:hypothetical protein